LEEDLLQEALLTLFHLIRGQSGTTFDPQNGARLWSFAQYAVRLRLIRVAWKEEPAPRAIVERRKGVRQAEARFQKREGRPPTIDELSEEAGETAETIQVIRLLETGRKTTVDSGAFEVEDDAEGAPDRELGGTLLRCLRLALADDSQAKKALILILLHENTGIQLKEIAGGIAGTGGKTSEGERRVPGWWSAVHDLYTLPPEVPASWEAVRELFGDGAPKVVSLDAGPPSKGDIGARNYEVLRKHYRRLMGKLRADRCFRACMQA
jgi:hypothetical protein